MQRYLYVKNGIVQNIVDYEDGVTPPAKSDDGEDIVLDPTGTTNVGDPFDVKSAVSDRTVTEIEPVVFDELLRLTNAVRTLQPDPQSALTEEEYRAFLSSNLTAEA
jgi:hypothetical protein